jgi:uncharacterized protein YjbJ (UPF0337 family)
MGVAVMSGKTDIIQGRIKEAAGALTGNDALRAEGQTDQAVGEVKQAANQAVTDAQEAAHTAIGKAKQAAQKSIDKARGAAKKMSK